MNTETFETFPARVGHVRAALYNLRYRRAERMPMHIARRAESLLCDLGERLENGETWRPHRPIFPTTSRPPSFFTISAIPTTKDFAPLYTASLDR